MSTYFYVFTFGGIHPGRVEPASPTEKHGNALIGSWHTEVLNPGVAAFIGFAAQAKLVPIGSDGASALHTLHFTSTSDDATGAQGIGVWSADVG